MRYGKVITVDNVINAGAGTTYTWWYNGAPPGFGLIPDASRNSPPCGRLLGVGVQQLATGSGWVLSSLQLYVVHRDPTQNSFAFPIGGGAVLYDSGPKTVGLVASDTATMFDDVFGEFSPAFGSGHLAIGFQWSAVGAGSSTIRTFLHTELEAP
jgi:hypothetical protein